MIHTTVIKLYLSSWLRGHRVIEWYNTSELHCQWLKCNELLDDKNLYSAIDEKCRGARWQERFTLKRWDFNRFLKVARVSELTTLSGSEFQTVGAATEKARLAKTVPSSRNGQPRCVAWPQWLRGNVWRRLMVRTSVFGWRTFPDLRLSYGWHVTTSTLKLRLYGALQMCLL